METKPNNVVAFPTKLKGGEILPPPDFRDRQAKEFIAMFLEEFNHELISNIALNGFDTSHPTYVRNMAVITQLIEIALYQCTDVSHDLDEILRVIVDEIFNGNVESDSEEEGGESDNHEE